MTPIEWNDSEPGFPDHLPPKPYVPEMLTQRDVEWRIQQILKAAGVECLITEAKITARFPGGGRIHYADLEVDTTR